MPKYKVEYSDSVVIEANSEQEAIHEAWQQMFCDGPKDYCFYANEGDDNDDFDIDENEEDDNAEVVVLEHGKIYDCSYFDDNMNGCSIRLKAVTRKGELVLKELDCSKVHKKTEFYYIELSDDQSPDYHRTWNKIED